MRKMLVISIALTGLTLLVSIESYAQQQAHSVSPQQATKSIKIISTAGARALADACSGWAEQNKQVVAMAILDWGGNLVESHAMEGAPMNAIDLSSRLASHFGVTSKITSALFSRYSLSCTSPDSTRLRFNRTSLPSR